jgi:hypothetical protein
LYLHSVSTECIYIVYLHSVDRECIYRVYLQSVSTECIYRVYLQCVSTEGIYRVCIQSKRRVTHLSIEGGLLAHLPAVRVVRDAPALRVQHLDLGHLAVLEQTLVLHCTALHSSTLHCTALHCTALHLKEAGNLRQVLVIEKSAASHLRQKWAAWSVGHISPHQHFTTLCLSNILATLSRMFQQRRAEICLYVSYFGPGPPWVAPGPPGVSRLHPRDVILGAGRWKRHGEGEVWCQVKREG